MTQKLIQISQNLNSDIKIIKLSKENENLVSNVTLDSKKVWRNYLETKGELFQNIFSLYGRLFQKKVKHFLSSKYKSCIASSLFLLTVDLLYYTLTLWL